MNINHADMKFSSGAYTTQKSSCGYSVSLQTEREKGGVGRKKADFLWRRPWERLKEEEKGAFKADGALKKKELCETNTWREFFFGIHWPNPPLPQQPQSS